MEQNCCAVCRLCWVVSGSPLSPISRNAGHYKVFDESAGHLDAISIINQLAYLAIMYVHVQFM